jgi:hypothetical protein
MPFGTPFICHVFLLSKAINHSAAIAIVYEVLPEIIITGITYIEALEMPNWL